MTDRTLTVTLTMPDDMDEDLGGMSIVAEAVGVDSELAPVFLLAAAEAMMRSQIRSDMEKQNPMATGDLLDALAMLNGRLKVVDEVMHLPVAGPSMTASLEL